MISHGLPHFHRDHSVVVDRERHDHSVPRVSREARHSKVLVERCTIRSSLLTNIQSNVSEVDVAAIGSPCQIEGLREHSFVGEGSASGNDGLEDIPALEVVKDDGSVRIWKRIEQSMAITQDGVAEHQ